MAARRQTDFVTGFLTGLACVGAVLAGYALIARVLG
jgi:hypothetical protein